MLKNPSVDLSNHPCLRLSADLKKCYTPLASIGVTYFNYVKLFRDGRRAVLSNKPDWLFYFYRNGQYDPNSIIQQECSDTSDLNLYHQYIWTRDCADQPFALISNLYNIGNGTTLICRLTEAIDVFYFAGTIDDGHLVDFFHKNVALLKRYVHFFKNQARTLISSLDECRFTTGDNEAVDNKIQNNGMSEGMIEDFMSQTTIKKSNIEFLDCHLTRRQMEILHFLGQGLTLREIADKIGSSSRTVECQFQRIKSNLQLTSKASVISFCEEMGIFQYLQDYFVD